VGRVGVVGGVEGEGQRQCCVDGCIGEFCEITETLEPSATPSSAPSNNPYEAPPSAPTKPPVVKVLQHEGFENGFGRFCYDEDNAEVTEERAYKGSKLLRLRYRDLSHTQIHNVGPYKKFAFMPRGMEVLANISLWRWQCYRTIFQTRLQIAKKAVQAIKRCHGGPKVSTGISMARSLVPVTRLTRLRVMSRMHPLSGCDLESPLIPTTKSCF
jgi:hypothetical protein